jgi:hypothetical protein
VAQPDAAGPSTAVHDLDGADDKDLSLVAATATAHQRIVFAAAVDLGLINLDEAGQRGAVGASMLQRSLAQSSHAVL